MAKQIEPGTKVKLLKDIKSIDIDGEMLAKAGEIVTVADWNDWPEDGIVVGNDKHSFLVETDEYEVVEEE